MKGNWNRDGSEFEKREKGKDVVHQKFSVILSVQEIEALVFAMCRLLIDQYEGDQNGWPEELGF